MRVAFITRSTFHKIHGGSGIQVTETARNLENYGVKVTIHLAHEKIDYSLYDLFHFFDLTRPANILYHLKRLNKPAVLTPILIDYSEFDKKHRTGFSGLFFKMLSPGKIEYIKTISRWMAGSDTLKSKSYLFKGQLRSIKEVLEGISLLLPNSFSEYKAIEKIIGPGKPFMEVANGIDPTLFTEPPGIKKDPNMVVCAARIEGIKNQLNLIRALNNTDYSLFLIGEHSKNQASYFKKCKSHAAGNIHFVGKLSQQELLNYYARAKVHILPSWFETCGLSSLEAAAMGCNVVISNRGFASDYFGDYAFYCDPEDTGSIYNAVKNAAGKEQSIYLKNKVGSVFTWANAARKTAEAYSMVLNA